MSVIEQTPVKISTMRELILEALSLVQGEPVPGSPVELPSARSRKAVEMLIEAGTIEKLQELRPDMRALVSDLFDWAGTKGTKSNMRAALAALMARGPDGRSRYPQAVEMLSFASTISPLLEPDQLARVIAAAGATVSAYRPVIYPATAAAGLVRVVGHYQSARLETLFISLWEVAHNARWWDTCGGLGAPARTARRRRRVTPDGEDEETARMRERSRAIARMTSARDKDLVEGIVNGSLVLTPQTLSRLRALRLPDGLRTVAAEAARGQHDDPDQSVLFSQLADLAPGDRPPSPLPVLVESLEFMLGDQEPARTLPRKPTSWAELYPDASFESYPLPEHLLELQWKDLLSTGQDSAAAVVVEWCKNPHELFANRDYMGNCTGGYDHRCRQGTCFIGKVHHNGEVYNFSVEHHADPHGPKDWYVTQVNSRFNHSNVPSTVANALNRTFGRR